MAFCSALRVPEPAAAASVVDLDAACAALSALVPSRLLLLSSSGCTCSAPARADALLVPGSAATGCTVDGGAREVEADPVRSQANVNK